MSVVKNIIESIRAFTAYDLESSLQQQTFAEELNERCGRILFFVCLITMVAWLSYIPLDCHLHPEQPFLPYIRIGLSLISLIVLILYLTRRFPESHMLFLVVIGAYLAISCGFLTALTKADPVYMGGYIFILTLMAVVPVDRRAALLVVASSLLTFLITGFFTGISLDDFNSRYSFLDLTSATFVSISFIFMLHDTRYTSWLKSKKIERQSLELRSDKEKIDKLLLNILPPPVAQELKEYGYVKPVFYSAATIVFTDFVGFTTITEKLSPDQLVSELDEVFSHFDRVMDKYGLEKLKTIGDSYMYAGGVPIVNNTHEIDAVLGALEIQSFVEEINQAKTRDGRPIFEIRIGINTGALMAGVVGEKKFVYDVWGDSVNLASRMESSCEKGRVNVSQSTYFRIRDFFETEPRGKIMAKNKGTVEMYFVKRIWPELSSDPQGFQPNQRFWDRYDIFRNRQQMDDEPSKV